MKAFFATPLALLLSLMLPVAVQAATTGAGNPGAVAPGERSFLLAEYRADRDLDTPGATSGWTTDIDTSVTSMTGGNDSSTPLDLKIQTLAGSVERRMRLGPVTLGGAMDVEHQQAQWVGEPYSQEQSIRFGPKLIFGRGNVTHFYYGVEQEDLLEHQYGGPAGDSESTRTGLAHTWSWGGNGHIRVGYEFEQGSRQDVYQDMQAHTISVSGGFPMGWGLHAQLMADYSRNNYPEYGGRFGLVSDRRVFRATLSRSFGERFYGDLHYSYYDEDFGETPFTQRRRTFGVHLRYQY